jgi:anthranilate/para-aminobenzoate synthase component II
MPEWGVSSCNGFGEITRAVDECDIVAFGGGADIATEIYNNKPACAGAVERCSERDMLEVAIFNAALKVGKPILGICRGAQLVCAMSGGDLIQDVGGHACGDHGLITYDNVKGLSITSTHHQMMYLNNLPRAKYELLAWTERRGRTYTRDKLKCKEDPLVDPEVVYFPESHAFAIQGHPEYMGPLEPTVLWLRSKLLSFFQELI